MASTSVSRVVPASPDKVWSLIGGFDTLPDWLPYILESTALEGGRVRRLTNPDGDVIAERLVDFNVAEVQWSGRFHADGATEDEVVALFTGIYADGLDALHKTLAA